MNLIIENKLINPGVINLTQFSSGTDTLIFELENPIYENLDFKDDEYVAYAIAVLPTGKMMDKIELEKNIIDKKLTLIWKVTNYTTKVNGTLTYQIIFENTNKEVVWYSNNALMFVNSSINADDFLTAYYPSLLQQWMLKMEQLKILIQECTGVPVEGIQGQYLRKKTDEDFDCEWGDIINDIKTSSKQAYSSQKIASLLSKKADTSTATSEKNGLMSAEDKEKIDNIESDAEKNTITGVKGNMEDEYRTGNVNITPKDIGAVPSEGTGHLVPEKPSESNVGSPSKPYNVAYIDTISFDGGKHAMNLIWDDQDLNSYFDKKLTKYGLVTMQDHSMHFIWTGSRLALYIDRTLVGYVNLSTS